MKDSKRNITFTVRISAEEYGTICEKAAQCGLSKSSYVRKVLTGHQPKARLTERELLALEGLSSARGDLIKVSNVLKGKSQEERKAFFRDVNFMRYWINAVSQLIEQWRNLQERILGN